MPYETEDALLQRFEYVQNRFKLYALKRDGFGYFVQIKQSEQRGNIAVLSMNTTEALFLTIPNIPYVLSKCFQACVSRVANQRRCTRIN